MGMVKFDSHGTNQPGTGKYYVGSPPADAAAMVAAYATANSAGSNYVFVKLDGFSVLGSWEKLFVLFSFRAVGGFSQLCEMAQLLFQWPGLSSSAVEGLTALMMGVAPGQRIEKSISRNFLLTC